MSNQDCLQLLCNETPEFSLYFQEFQQIYSRPAAEYRIAVCGSPTVQTFAVADGLIKIGQGAFTQVLTGSAVVSPVYLAIPLTDEHVLQDIGIQQTLIGADAIVVIHDLPATEFNGVERCLLHSLRDRFPDLHQRLIVLLNHADDIADHSLDRLSAAIRRNLTTQLTLPPAILAMEYCLTWAEGDERVVAPARAPLLALHQTIYHLLDNYNGELPDMRAASIRALMDSLDFFVTKAIKHRKKQLAAEQNELNHCFTLWQRDLQRLGESLRTRIADYRQR